MPGQSSMAGDHLQWLPVPMADKAVLEPSSPFLSVHPKPGEGSRRPKAGNGIALSKPLLLGQGVSVEISAPS